MKWASLVAQTIKNPPAMQETQVQFLGWEDPLEKGMATHSSILAWEIPGQRSLVGYSPWSQKESDMTERLTQRLNTGHGSESESRSVLSDSLRPHGYAVHGILQARILDWAAFPFSRGPSQPRDWTWVSCIAGGFFTTWATRKARPVLIGTSNSQDLRGC